MTEDAQIIEQNPFTEDVVPVQAGNLSAFLRDDRSGWMQEDYLEALKEAIMAKGLSQWAIGMFMYEIKQKWSQVTYDTVAAHLGISPHSLQSYTLTYSAYVKYRPEFMPSDEYSYTFLRTVADLSRKQGKDPVKELERLADKGIIENHKAAYKDMKEEETGTVLPVLPKFTTRWDQYTQFIELRGGRHTDPEALKLINWTKFAEWYTAMTGEKMTITRG